MDKIVKSLNHRNFDARYFESKQEALVFLLNEFEENKILTWGGSMTLEEIGIKEAIKNKPLNIINRESAKSPEEKRRMQIESFGADYYLMSSNAITEDGKLINIDGVGNRVAAMIYGPKNVYIIAGKNKICKTEKEAIERARKYAAPLNSKRLNLDTPCVKTGECQHCLSTDCICSHIVITRRSREKGRIKVILINENLGI